MEALVSLALGLVAQSNGGAGVLWEEAAAWPQAEIDPSNDVLFTGASRPLNPAAPPFLPAGWPAHPHPHPHPIPPPLFPSQGAEFGGSFGGAPAPSWYYFLHKQDDLVMSLIHDRSQNQSQAGGRIYSGTLYMRRPTSFWRPYELSNGRNEDMPTPSRAPRAERYMVPRSRRYNGADNTSPVGPRASEESSQLSHEDVAAVPGPPSPGSLPRLLDLRFASEFGDLQSSASSSTTNSNIPLAQRRTSFRSLVEDHHRPTAATWNVQFGEDYALTPRALGTMSERAAPPEGQQGQLTPSRNQSPAKYASPGTPGRFGANRGMPGTPTRNPLINRGMANSTRGLTSSQGGSASGFNPAANSYNPGAQRVPGGNNSGGYRGNASASGGMSSNNSGNRNNADTSSNNSGGRNTSDMSAGTASYINTGGNNMAPNNSGNSTGMNTGGNAGASYKNTGNRGDMSTGTTGHVNTGGNTGASSSTNMGNRNTGGNPTGYTNTGGNTGASSSTNMGNRNTGGNPTGYTNTGGNTGASSSTNMGNRNTGGNPTGYTNTGGNAGAPNNLALVGGISSAGPAPSNFGFNGNIGGLAGSSLPAFVAIFGRPSPRGNIANNNTATYNQMALQAISDNTSLSIDELSRPNVDPFGAIPSTNSSSLLTPPDGMSRKMRELTEGGRSTPSGDAALNVYFLPFITLCSQHPKQSRYGVLVIKNIPYTLTRSEVLAFIGRNAKIVPESENESIHIIMERVTSKTLDCYVEFTSVNEAIAAVDRFQSLKMAGRSGRLGPRHVEVELSSQEDLMRQLFPKAKNVKWVGISPTIIPKDPNDKYNSGFQGFISNEELVMLVKHVEYPQRSPFSRDCPQRPFECLISTLSKYPWHMTQYITLADRKRLFDATVKLVKFLLYRIRNEDDPVHLNKPLLRRVVKACLACDGFTPVMKDDIVFWTSLDGRRAYELGHVPHADGWAAIHTLGAKKDVEYDLLMFYVKLIHDWTMKNARRPSLAEQAERGYSGFHATTMFGRVEQFLDLANAFHPKTLGEATLAEVAVREWLILERIIRSALPGGQPKLE
ncbi:hypothetical protein HYFRA_00008802 [Hymenoscyphus fraxineus]|uniref:RRM domain-containing protein n=1 Tax=Hymenoscyphus fraxineus TaxID=746836 RepID=A0A9N9L0I4_9HELO|nr:hypothetical protein HYFRA_00008802 [Hymenoscyphus fraxineus]